MANISSTLQYLSQVRNADGGWGYHPGQNSAVEPTAAVLCLLSATGELQALEEQAAAWLLHSQHSDGGWGYSPRDRQSTWLTAWAILGLAQAGDPLPELSLGAQWLLDVELLSIANDEMQTDFRRNAGIDITVRGWPWLPGEAAWVEPTALSMLALQSLPPTSAITARLAEGVRCLTDRRCQAGGWNVGSPEMLGAAMPPRAVPTAWSILALAGLAPEAIRAEDVAALRSEMAQDNGTQALAWGWMALQRMGMPGEEVHDRLATRQASNGSWDDNPYHTAIAALALELKIL